MILKVDNYAPPAIYAIEVELEKGIAFSTTQGDSYLDDPDDGDDWGNY